MKTLKELGISPAPWLKAKSCGDMVVCDKSHIAISAASRPEDVLLLAAAPELYEALKEVYEDFPMCGGECGECPYENNCKKWSGKARAALEKAGGAEVEL